MALYGREDAPYGFCDDAETRALLRSDPPDRAMAWVEEVAGGRVSAIRALPGGLSSAMHALELEAAGGDRREVVLRRYVRPELNEEEPELAAREAAALRVVARIDVPTPGLLAVDPDGAMVGTPSVLMTRLPGAVEWSPPDVDAWLAGMALLLPSVHAAALPGDGSILAYSPYGQASYEPPAWTRDLPTWERAIEIFHSLLSTPADDEEVLIHRDFHPGNVLWSDGAVSGLVDWPCTSIGPSVVDIGHCRANLVPYGLDVVERFTRLASGRDGYPGWADIATLVGCLDDLRDDPPDPSTRDALDLLMGRAVADCA
ncbi:MAG TPA: aminoglycoside phosphotransferase family protein [Acidimicrobiales bacterium]|nr:aminoglycoside phosphotransferase family protein [Acidimicrobiales bacterium]